MALGRLDEAIAELDKLREPRDQATPRVPVRSRHGAPPGRSQDEGIKWAMAAKQAAQRYGQRDLAAAIERDLARLK